MAELRAARAREHSCSVLHWNEALRGLGDPLASPAARAELEKVLAKAGYPHGVTEAMPSPEVGIASYTQWSLDSVTEVTRHSAMYRLSSSDPRRGTPHPRGRGLMPEPMTWHTTLLAEVGANAEGPLPWVERDYTPVSSAKEWESGRVDLLIKTYPDGAATSWLRRERPARVWLSRPVQTLSVPGLVPEPSFGPRFSPASVLLLLAGTGAVVLPQLLQHRDPIRQLGFPTRRDKQLRVPIDLVLSCREDDVLLVSELAQWCREGGETSGVRSCTLLLTAANQPPCEDGSPAASGASGAAEAEATLEALPNARVLRTRLNQSIVSEATARMQQPCRVVVSGPGPFNAAASEWLAAAKVSKDRVTVLAA
mmetsp:Transcript_2980/g.7136  ORF Transcript_2980/g.7136 Transcript_2980/m.7136 type:complete len:367 (-) Transcript_2980:289-1389(-)